ncbi:MAG: metallophosphoesterase family protein, partial [Candidatus Omnitrophica bacterium]|nr:metallophosphoesterase family protein [Candidatus Omnitrophota bacterium]
NNLRVLASHGHIFTKEEWISIGKKWKINILISGHTHIPILKKIDEIIILNPGSPSLPKEKIPTCAQLDLCEKTVRIFNLLDFSEINREYL